MLANRLAKCFYVTKKIRTRWPGFQIKLCRLAFKLGLGQRERLIANRFLHEATSNAASAYFHASSTTFRKCNANSLKIRAKLATSFSSNLRTDTAEILRFTASLNSVSHLRALATNFANASHDQSRQKVFSNEARDYSRCNVSRNRKKPG